MSITITQLSVGFAAAMTGPALAAHLGVPTRELWDRLRVLTPPEEAELAAAMERGTSAHPA